MFKRIKNLIAGPGSIAADSGRGSFARPVKSVAGEERRSHERRTRTIPVTTERRVNDRRASTNNQELAREQAPGVADAIAEEAFLLKTGTGPSVVVPMTNMRRVDSGDVSPASSLIKGSVEVESGPKSQGHGTRKPIHAVAPAAPAMVVRSTLGPVRHNIETEAELLTILGRPWRGLLSGVVASELANQCIPLDMQCGLVAVVLSEHALTHAHWVQVRKRIETEWSYRITDICVAPAEVVAKLHVRCLTLAERNHIHPLTHENCFVRVYDDIVEAAIRAKASDIHFETDDGQGRVRLRVYGKLRPWLQIPEKLVLDSLGAAFGSRIKSQTATKEVLNSQNPIAFMTEQPVGGSKWDGRVNGRPHATGYKAVMRLLESSTKVAEIPTFEDLGYNASQREMLGTAMARQWGVIIAFGSTGEGKSTTLRSMMVSLAGSEEQEQCAISVESPVEYKIPGIFQINVPVDVTLTSEEIARKYTAILRDAMRMDPDILMVGEIRDHETANTAIEFTTTGHRCFTTMHAEGSIDGLQRMTGSEMRIPPDTLAGGKVINTCLYQKLLPLLCRHCKLPASDSRHGLSESKRHTLAKKFLLDPGTMFVANPAGCKHCKPSVAGLAANGTKGVAVAAEIFTPTPAMLPLIAVKNWSEIARVWRSQRTTGFANSDMRGKTAFEHGLLLLSEGRISLKDLEGKFEPVESYEIFEMDGTR